MAPARSRSRLVLLGGVAGVALHFVWTGTTPAVLLAGGALLIAGLDAVEALAQEVDTRAGRSPSRFRRVRCTCASCRWRSP